MKIFLGNSPWSKKGFYGVRAGSRWPHFEKETTEYMPFPFFLAYAAALLEEDGFEVLLVDAIAEKISEEQFVRKIEAFGPDLILLEVSTISIAVDLALAKKLRKKLSRSVKLALCGLHALMYKTNFLEENQSVDFVLFGEYEYTIQELIVALTDGKPLGDIGGLIFRLSSGEVVKNPRRPLISDLDKLPWPARHFLPIFNYHDEPGSIPTPSVQIWTSRGCPFKCIYCAWPQIMYGDNSYRTRRPARVVDEIEWLIDRWGFKSFYIDDDTFNIGKERVLEFCRLLRERHVNVPWAAMARADKMDREMLEEMVKSGLAAIKYGVESASQELIDRSGKNLDLQQALRVIKMTREMGVKFHLTFMFGLPGETEKTIEETIRMARELDPESLQFTICTPFPGSAYYYLLEKEGCILTRDWSRYDGYSTSVIRSEDLGPGELEKALHNAENAWSGHIKARRFIGRGREDRRRKCSIIVPNWNGEKVLEECLSSLQLQDHDNYEILIVDDCSTDGSRALLKKKFAGLKVIKLNENRGFATAVNEGIKQAEGEYIAVINNDCVAESSWLSELSSVLNEHPETGLCSSKALNYYDRRRIDSLGAGMNRSGYTYNIFQGRRVEEAPGEIKGVLGASGCAAIYRACMLEDIGDFDEDYHSYLEDVDLSLRARLKGYECLFVPGAVVYHRGAFSRSGVIYDKDSVYLICRNTIFTLIKDMPRSLIKKNILRIAMFLLYSVIFHLLWTRHPRACLKGYCHGFKNFKRTLVKRRRILGGMCVSDRLINQILT